MKQKKKKHHRKSTSDVEEPGASSESTKASRKKKRKNSDEKSHESVNSNGDSDVRSSTVASPKKKRKSAKEPVNVSNPDVAFDEIVDVETDDLSNHEIVSPKKKRKSAKEPVNDSNLDVTFDEIVDVETDDVSNHEIVSPKKKRKSDKEELPPNDDEALDESVDAETGKGSRKRRRRSRVAEEEAVDGALDKRQKEVLYDDTPVIHVVKQKALDVIKLLGEQEKRPKFGKNCRFLVPGKIAPKQPDGYEHIAWDSTTYIVQMARQCILKHDWRLLKDFIPLLMKYRHIKNYAKELAYLYFVVNAETEDDEALSEFRRLCFASVKEPDKRDGSVWYRV